MKAEFIIQTKRVLKKLGIKEVNPGASTGSEWYKTKGETRSSYSPINGKEIAKVQFANPVDYEQIIKKAQEAFKIWRDVPAPKRGEVVRQIGLELRNYKKELGFLVSLEMGKIIQESYGEVQEMIDICDFAVGQSRQLYGYTMSSERENHRMFEQYHPLGIAGVITSFNFPVAVWAWNAMLAVVCGDVVIWKPSSKTPLTSIAVHNIITGILKKNKVPEGVLNLIITSSSQSGNAILDDKRISLISLTGSTAVGRQAGGIVGKRLGKVILELGGNNAVIVSQHADIDLVIPAVVFGALGTAGQRCTTTRRLLIQENIYNDVSERLINAYQQFITRTGNPLDEKTLIGPLIDSNAVDAFKDAIDEVKKEGGKLLFGGEILKGKDYDSGLYVIPAIVEAKNQYKIVQQETFAPILYLIKFKTLKEAVSLNNNVPQGLSSSIFTTDIREAGYFLSHSGSDCGIANVNIGTSGAEIGGAFGGEKDTGGGRESGSDAWKGYMRRQTNTINYGTDLPLAQGIKFHL